MNMWFSPCSVNAVNNINWFLYIELSLHPRDKPYLFMVYDPFNVLLDPVCYYLVEIFCIYSHQGYWPTVLLFCPWPHKWNWKCALWDTPDRNQSLISTLKSQNIGHMLQLLLPPGEAGSWEFPPDHAVSGKGQWRRGAMNFYYWLQCSWFLTYLWCRSLWTVFWISHKWNWCGPSRFDSVDRASA